MAGRILIVTWEYPPIVEGGLARHVRKLAEQLIAQGSEVHVLTRGGRSTRDVEERHGVTVHRVAEPAWPRDDLPRFVAWVRRLNDDLLVRGGELAARVGFYVVHGHDWLVAVAAKRLADRLRCPFVATVHATEHGRRQGWVHEPPMSDALEALPGVIERVGAVRFLVAGAGPHRGELERQAAALGLLEHVTFLGWIGDDRLSSLYRIADLCVVPSIYEPFGMVALEAMASGCPCLVADTGGLREVVPDGTGGLRFRSRDPAALGSGIERVLTDHALRARLIVEAGEHVLRFSWADVARRTGAVYADLLGAAV